MPIQGHGHARDVLRRLEQLAKESPRNLGKLPDDCWVWKKDVDEEPEEKKAAALGSGGCGVAAHFRNLNMNVKA
jgi:hypothetical protein